MFPTWRSVRFAAPRRSGQTRRALLATAALMLSAVLAAWLPINLALTCG